MNLKMPMLATNLPREMENYPFRGKGEKLLSLKELLERFPHMFVSINMKESPDTYEGSLMPSKLWRLIEEVSAEDRVAVTSSYDEQIDRFNLYAQNRVATGAGDDEVKKVICSLCKSIRTFV